VVTPSSPRYGLHADRYRRFRPGYPGWLFDRAAEACGAPHAHAVELGAGSGQATGEILKRFEKVTAIEPDADMAALIPRDPRLEVLIGTAEEADLGGPIDAAFSATAFHWMDPKGVGAMLGRVLRPGGVFLAFGYGPFQVIGPEPARRLIEAEHALWAGHVDTRLSAWRPYPELLAEAGVFGRVEEIAFTFEEARTPEAAAGLFLTTSYAAEHARLTGDETTYCAGLARRMEQAASGAPVTVRFVVTGGLAFV
jgi:SAM-dependent methyltransferase